MESPGHLHIHGGKTPSAFLQLFFHGCWTLEIPMEGAWQLECIWTVLLQEMFVLEGLTLGLNHAWCTSSAWVIRIKVGRQVVFCLSGENKTWYWKHAFQLLCSTFLILKKKKAGSLLTAKWVTRNPKQLYRALSLSSLLKALCKH